MSTKTINEQRIRDFLGWNNEDIKLHREKFEGLIPKVTIQKIQEIRTFAATIKGNLDAKIEAVKKKFPEQF